MKKTLKQTLILLCIAIFLGFLVNFINPNGVPLVMDTEKYSKDTEEPGKVLDQLGNDGKDLDLSNPDLGNTHHETKESTKPVKINYDFAKQLFDRKAVFVDGRPANEFAEGHIPGAINIPYADIREKTPEDKRKMVQNINENAVIVTYCSGSHCDISIDVAYELFDLGYKNINIYLGGLGEWVEKGYPTEK
ncbi:MAG: rhodanese-like domain-containing protein [Ignavibacteriae bacterium]|nr:rhodanese-like domain-containing protein [Ignavibacteriota bacterium]